MVDISKERHKLVQGEEVHYIMKNSSIVKGTVVSSDLFNHGTVVTIKMFDGKLYAVRLRDVAVSIPCPAKY